MKIGFRLASTRIRIALLGLLATALPGAEAADRVVPVPLGGTLGDQKGEIAFGVYVPTRFGGELTVKSSAGKIASITGPDGRERPNGAEIGFDRHGWHTFKVTGIEKDQAYQVETSFTQVGRSTRKPWNFYYWPTKADAIHEPWAGGNGRVDTMRPYGDDVLVASAGGYIAPGQDIIRAGPNGLLETPVSPGDESTWFPNLYDDLTWRGADGTIYATPSPLLKYDQLLGTTARGWEAAFTPNNDIQRWPGHCLGGAVASILLNEPTPGPGTGMTRDELKALWAELGENHYNHQIGQYVTDIPFGPPHPGGDVTDSYAPRVHALLESFLRGQRKALLGNLRAFPPRGTSSEVWNHGIGEYTAVYHAIPGRGERSVRLDVELRANSGSSINGQDDKPRLVKYQYDLIYDLEGKVDESFQAGVDWISVGGEAMFSPLNIMEVLATRWAGHNPYVTESNVRALDVANGGGGGRFAFGSPPNFRPVGNYESGRQMFARGGSSDGSPDTPSPRRTGGLFRLFRGR